MNEVLYIKQGETLEGWIDLLEEDGTVIEPTTEGPGYTVAWAQVRNKAAYETDSVVLLELTTANGGISLGIETDSEGVDHSGSFYASPAATAALLPWGEGQFEIWMRDAGNTDARCLAEIPCVLSPAVAVE